MSTTSLIRPVAAVPALVHFLRLYGKETKYEFLKLLRAKSFSLSIIGFPLMFYVIFGVANRHVQEGSVDIAKYMLGGYACFGLIGGALFGIAQIDRLRILVSVPEGYASVDAGRRDDSFVVRRADRRSSLQ